MDINYRRATLDDVDVLVAFRLRFLADRAGSERAPAEDILANHLRDYFREAMPRGAFIAWLAERDGDVVAYGNTAATDHNIDTLVYVLYGLTDEEIKVVES